MQIRKGISGGQYKPLSEEDILQIHNATLKTFAEVGVQVNNDEAFALFREAGADVDETDRIVKIQPDLVKTLVDRAPSQITLYGREPDGSLDCTIGQKRVYMGTGGTALNVLEPGSEAPRQSELKDIQNMARTVEALDNIHFYMVNLYPHDIDQQDVDVNRFGAALNQTRKHIMGGVYTVEGVRNVIRMAEMIAGGREHLKAKPFISMVACTISPFKLDEEYSRLAMEVARHSIPLVIPAEPLCGATAPITLAGDLLVLNVDTLAGVMLAQLANPGTPVLYGCVASITDLHDMKYLAGAVEMGLLNAGAAQMAQFYNLPIYATAGMSDTKTLDVQAGYESAITSLLVAMAGGNFIHDAAGFIEFCMTASYAKLVIDNEIIGMVMRAVEGIRVTEESLAYDLIKSVGPGGHFVSARHTRRHMRNEQYRPQLSDRQNRSVWEQAGAKDAAQRAIEKAETILAEPPNAFISADVRQQIKSEITGLRSFLMDG